jgi:hypothetical protein
VADDFIVADDEKNGNDSDDYEPTQQSINVKMGTKDKGKGKAKEDTQKDDKRTRKQPESTGVVREKSCKRCVRLKKDCINQKEGLVCYTCAVVKMKCEEPVEGEEITEKKTRATKLAKKPATQRQKRPATQHTKVTPATKNTSTSSPAITPPPQASSSKRRPVSPPPQASSSKRRAQSPPPQEPKPKRRAPTKKKEELPPAAYTSLLERIEKLEDGFISQREIIDAFLPGYFRLKDKVDTLHGAAVEMDNDFTKLRVNLE